jgi:hypothetical protein
MDEVCRSVAIRPLPEIEAADKTFPLLDESTSADTVQHVPTINEYEEDVLKMISIKLPV